MRRMRRVKIVATLGPASNDEATIEKLARAGADVFRINMSHASHELLKQTVGYIRSVEARLHGGGTAFFPVEWGVPDAAGAVEGVLTGSIGANLNAWVGAAGSTAWDAADKVAFSATAIRVRARIAAG